MTTWAAVSSASQAWRAFAGYVRDDYYTDDEYIEGIEPSPDSWSATAAAATTWTAV